VRRCVISLLALVVAAFACAGNALGAYNPKMFVSDSPDSVSVDVELAAGDDATAAVTLYAPPGTRLSARQRGIGVFIAGVDIAGRDLGDVPGQLQVANGADPAIAAATTACTGTATHAAVWELTTLPNPRLPAPIDIPVSVDKVTGAEAAFSSYMLRICFHSPYVPASQGGEPNGVKLYSIVLGGLGSLTPPAGKDLRWTGTFVPYEVGTKTPNLPASAESQAIASSPVRFRLAGKDVVSRHVVGRGRHRHVITVHRARLVGRLTAAGEGQAGADYTLVSNRKPGGEDVATGKTNARGAFTRLVALPRTTIFVADVALGRHDIAEDCTPLLPISTNPLIIPTYTAITSATIALISNVVTVRKRRA